MEWLESIPDNYRWLAIPIFVTASALYAAWSSRRGQREGGKPRVQEFAMAGQLADMGPVKELVEQTGLLVQQQIRTNIVLERIAVVGETAVKAYEARIERAETNEQIEEARQEGFAQGRASRTRRAARRPVRKAE